MTYATRQDLVARFGADEIDRLDPLDDPVARGAVALADAAAAIDAALAPAYDVTALQTGGYGLLVSVACDLARANLYDETVPDVVQARATAAAETLASLVSGDLALVGMTGAPAPRRAQAQVVARDREFAGADFDDRIGGLDQF